MITGGLGLNWHERKFGVLPRLENSEISGVNPATLKRMALWLDQGVHVRGRPEWLVVKLHSHGAAASNRAALTGAEMAQFHQELAQFCAESGCDGKDALKLHYVSARELYNIVRAAEAGLNGDPGQYRNHEVVWSCR
jgi:hypothetical protein